MTNMEMIQNMTSRDLAIFLNDFAYFRRDHLTFCKDHHCKYETECKNHIRCLADEEFGSPASDIYWWLNQESDGE